MATQKPLRFINIAKNAGTSIEEIGREHGLLWGSYDPEYVEVGQLKTLLSRHTLPSKLSPDYLTSHDFFMVVRNPYERTVSQVLYINNVRTANQLNSNIRFNKSRLNPEGGIRGDQFQYFIPGVHILRFEHLEADFNALMIQYGLPARFTKHISRSVNVGGLTVDDLDEESVRIIQTVCKQDFETFGYSLEVPNHSTL